MQLVTTAAGVDPDGKARWIVRVRFVDAGGSGTKLLRGGDVEFYSSRGDAQWQTRSRYDGPAAIVRTTVDGPLAIRAALEKPTGISDARAETDTRTWNGLKVVAQPLGPHVVQIGWFPAARDTVSVVRSGPDGARTVCEAAAGSSSCRDISVRPGYSYHYSVRQTGQSAQLKVTIPAEPAPQSLDAIRGKGMWIQFSPTSADSNAYSRLDASAFSARAKAAGIRYIEVRLAYGEFWEITRSAKPYVDALIDAAADAGIAVIAWTVPRATTFDDLALATAAANYRTPRGTKMSGLAIDLERGGEYMGDGLSANEAIAGYARRVREALGPRFLIVGTVQDPYLASLTNSSYPFAAVAQYSDALQPMTYWRMFRAGLGTDATRSTIRKSVTVLRREAGRQIPINVGGQTLGLGPCGAPTPAEIVGSLAESRRDGAIGETFFDWFGTADNQWEAIGSFSWP